MKIEYLKKEEVTKKAKVELNVHDYVEFYDFLNKEWVLNKPPTFIRRMVESRYFTYVVLSNGTYRPMSTYGKTWRKSYQGG